MREKLQCKVQKSERSFWVRPQKVMSNWICSLDPTLFKTFSRFLFFYFMWNKNVFTPPLWAIKSEKQWRMLLFCCSHIKYWLVFLLLLMKLVLVRKRARLKEINEQSFIYTYCAQNWAWTLWSVEDKLDREIYAPVSKLWPIHVQIMDVEEVGTPGGEKVNCCQIIIWCLVHHSVFDHMSLTQVTLSSTDKNMSLSPPNISWVCHNFTFL